jgi:hypothetical protein
MRRSDEVNRSLERRNERQPAINRVIAATRQNGNLFGRAIGVRLKPRTIPGDRFGPSQRRGTARRHDRRGVGDCSFYRRGHFDRVRDS